MLLSIVQSEYYTCVLAGKEKKANVGTLIFQYLIFYCYALPIKSNGYTNFEKKSIPYLNDNIFYIH